MRTTLTIDSQVLAEFKRQAAETHRTLSGLIEAALREHLARQRDVAGAKPLEFPIVAGRGLALGIDPAGNAALLAAVDEADGVYERFRPGAGEAPESSSAGRSGRE
ncbi:MAG TPA: ribbon-helix-helix protein, CopG family [Thermoleophilia bacterium]|nr:ribbon-helix-helix protein, CopG family [Thermoleophilia bacterium]